VLENLSDNALAAPVEEAAADVPQDSLGGLVTGYTRLKLASRHGIDSLVLLELVYQMLFEVSDEVFEATLFSL